VISKGALAEYSQVELLLGVLLTDLRPKVVMELELYPIDTWSFIYDKILSISSANVRPPKPSPS
jgi:hypothetical protein